MGLNIVLYHGTINRVYSSMVVLIYKVKGHLGSKDDAKLRNKNLPLAGLMIEYDH